MSNRPDWRTPKSVFTELNNRFNFTIDGAASAENALLPRFWDIAINGLVQNWDCERVFINPPYGREIAKWTAKAAKSTGLVVALLPARTDTRWFHSDIYGYAQIEFIKGRLKFDDGINPAPFPSMVVIWNG
jgi:site-specific DNA-methyltransferase (adenine-specific)